MTDATALAPSLPTSSPPLVARLRDVAAGLALTRSEAVAWVALLIGALLVRVVRLGDPPLNVEEGRRALEAWTLLREGRVAYDAAPILTNVNSLLFFLFTDGDAQARLVPALAGVALVASPLLLRPVLGGWWALLAGLALAASATLLTASRSVAPTVPMLLCLMVVAAAAWRFGLTHQRGWLTAAFTAAQIGLGLDTAFVVGLAGLVLAYAIAEGDLFGRVSWWPPVRAHGPRALAVAAAVAILLDTRALTSPAGLQAGLIDPLSRWSGEVARGAGLTAPLLIGLMDGGVLLLALIGLLDYRWHPRAVRFLGTWLLVSLTLASLMRMPDLRYVSQALLPASLLAGLALLRLATWIAEAGSLLTTVLGLLALVPVVTVIFQVNLALQRGLSPWGASAVVLVAGLLLVGLLAFNLLRGAELGAALATWLLVILAVGGIAAASRALEARGSPRGQLAEQTVVTTDMEWVRQMALKWHRANPDGPLPVDPTLRPLVGWALRGIPSVRYETTAGQTGPRLLVDPPAGAEPTTMTVRTIVGYAADWSSLAPQPARVWRWLANRESLVTLRPYAIVVVQPAGR